MGRGVGGAEGEVGVGGGIGSPGMSPLSLLHPDNTTDSLYLFHLPSFFISICRLFSANFTSLSVGSLAKADDGILESYFSKIFIRHVILHQGID